MSRLVEKGALTERKEGKQLVYTAVLPRDAARQSALRSLVDNAFGGRFGSLVQHLAEGEQLSKRDRDELEELLRESDAKPSRKPARRGSSRRRGRTS